MTNKFQDFIHPSDKKALEALKAVPGFDTAVKAYMNIVAEKMFKIENTSSYLQLGHDQLPEIYAILEKVCNKLNIYPIPDLFLALDRKPNASTYGDTDIFIVINSGLLETLSLSQIETVIAHECGHIICHHTLYTTMGRLIMTGAELLANGIISKAVITSLQYAFAYWMRCSEFSADRVSAYYHESPEPVIDVMMALAGGTHNLNLSLNKDAFFRQAQKYKQEVENSTYNKILEFIQFGKEHHPLNAYRAYEINEFYKKYTNKIALNDEINGLIGAETIEYKLKIEFKYKYYDNTSEPTLMEMEVEEEIYIFEGEGSIEFIAQSGEIEFKFKINDKELICEYMVDCDACLVVTWDEKDQTIDIKEIR
ncbi:MAG: M48 family metallopeptidase [Bacilli bacterium]|nr:M48 family metallopeptidase [Bacilli bacterium]